MPRLAVRVLAFASSFTAQRMVLVGTRVPTVKSAGSVLEFTQIWSHMVFSVMISPN
jgi:hypothetical protein